MIPKAQTKPASRPAVRMDVSPEWLEGERNATHEGRGIPRPSPSDCLEVTR